MKISESHQEYLNMVKEKAAEFYQLFGRISAALLMRKYQIGYKIAQSICDEIKGKE